MIYSLHGTLVEKTADMAVVECAGVGYCVSIPSSTAGALPAVGQTCTLYTYMNVTENDVSLFGFADKESQAMFRLLTAVSGVGPKAGLAILNVLSPARVVLAVQRGDHKAFTAANGVGPKLGQRIVLELKDKVGKGFAGSLSAADFAAPAAPAGAAAQAQAALVGLGYTASEAAAALAGVDPALPVQGNDTPCFAGHWQKEVSHGAGNCGCGRFRAPCKPGAPRRKIFDAEATLRPKTLEEYIGQDKAKENLRVYLKKRQSCAVSRWTICFYTARRALAKLTLACIVAHEMGVQIRITSARPLKTGRFGRAADEFAGGRRAVHRRDPPPFPPGGRGAVPGPGRLRAGHHDRQGPLGAKHPHQPAALYAGGGDNARRANYQPLRDRFGVLLKLGFTPRTNWQNCHPLGRHFGRALHAGRRALEMARRSRGTPRVANRLLSACAILRR